MSKYIDAEQLKAKLVKQHKEKNLFGLTIAIEEIDAMPTVGWIPCSERLPEKEGNYLLSFEREPVEIGTWYIIDDGGFFGYDWAIEEPIAWMELPEPYTDEVEE